MAFKHKFRIIKKIVKKVVFQMVNLNKYIQKKQRTSIYSITSIISQKLIENMLRKLKHVLSKIQTPFTQKKQQKYSKSNLKAPTEILFMLSYKISYIKIKSSSIYSIYDLLIFDKVYNIFQNQFILTYLQNLYKMIKPKFKIRLKLNIVFALIIVFFVVEIATTSSYKRQQLKQYSKKQQETICDVIAFGVKKFKKLNKTEIQEEIKKLIKSPHENCVINLVPKYYWAQNMSFIFIKFQFLNSAETSACGKVLHLQKNVTHNGFWLNMFCLMSNKVIKYSLNVKTYKNLNFHFHEWRQTQQNGLILQGLKSPAPYFWNRLYSKAQPPQKKPKIWWSLQQKQTDKVHQYMHYLQIDEQVYQISEYVKKTKRNKKKSKFNNNQLFQDCSIQFYCNQGSPFMLGSWD